MSSSSVLQMQWTLNGQQTTVQFDASISEHHAGTAQVSQHQVETGPNITDHIRPMPMTLSLEAFVTNTPINSGILSPTASPAGQITNGVLQFSSSFNRVNDVYNALLEAQAGGALIAVTTSLSLYIDFAITSIGAPRDAEHGNAVQFSIELTADLDRQRHRRVSAGSARAEEVGKPEADDASHGHADVADQSRQRPEAGREVRERIVSFLVIDTTTAATSTYWDEIIQLDGVQYIFEFFWSDRESCWYMSILDQSQNYMATGLRLNVSWPLLRRFQNPALPQGLLYCLDTTGTGTEIRVPSDLGQGVLLMYVTPDEFVPA